MSVHDDLLVADFNQCFEQMRHYEEAFLKRVDFGFGGIVAVMGASAFLVEHFNATPQVLFIAGLLLAVSSVGGTILVWSLARNRIYFATVARYVNEIRAAYLLHQPGGVSNTSGMYSDHRFPQIFNPLSSQSIDIYFLSLCVSVLVSGAVTSFIEAHRIQNGLLRNTPWTIALVMFAVSACAQAGTVILYWYFSDRDKHALGTPPNAVSPETGVSPSTVPKAATDRNDSD